MNKNPISCDLLIIGAGVAGTAAALFSAPKGISTAVVGIASQLRFASGLLDLLGVHPVTGKSIRTDPWAAIRSMDSAMPKHPYARIHTDVIRSAFAEYMAALAEAGLHYRFHPNENTMVMTSVGTFKTTYAVPAGMWPAVAVFSEKRPCLIVDFEGFKGFSANHCSCSMAKHHPIKTARISISSLPGDFYPESIAREFESAEFRSHVVRSIRPHLDGIAAVGLPAVLGVAESEKVRMDLEQQLAVPVFEIPTLPPSVPGLRLETALEKQMSKWGVLSLLQQKVLSAQYLPGGGFQCRIGRSEPEITVHSQGVLLATGRFFGKGLAADRKGLRETVLNLPVFQPESRNRWHHQDLFHPEGHPINQAGLEVDNDFHPLGTNGKPVYPMLFAAGGILAHQDWMRMKCGTGMSLATAYTAVNSFLKLRPRKNTVPTGDMQ